MRINIWGGLSVLNTQGSLGTLFFSEPTFELKRAVETFTAKCICLLSACILSLPGGKYNLISFTDEIDFGYRKERRGGEGRRGGRE